MESVRCVWKILSFYSSFTHFHFCCKLAVKIIEVLELLWSQPISTRIFASRSGKCRVFGWTTDSWKPTQWAWAYARLEGDLGISFKAGENESIDFWADFHEQLLAVWALSLGSKWSKSRVSPIATTFPWGALLGWWSSQWSVGLWPCGQRLLRRYLLCFQDVLSFRNVFKDWVWKSSPATKNPCTSSLQEIIFGAKGPFFWQRSVWSFLNLPLPHPAWLADELMRLEHNLDVKEKGQHCCATWTAKNPTPTYCWVPASSSCLAWGQKAAVRDYSTVDDKMCKGKGRCWRHRKVPGDLNQTCPTSKKWGVCDSLRPEDSGRPRTLNIWTLRQ